MIALRTVWYDIPAIHVLESRRVSKLGFILEIDIICLYAAVIFEQGECAELLSKVFMREKLHGHLLFLVKS